MRSANVLAFHQSGTPRYYREERPHQGKGNVVLMRPNSRCFKREIADSSKVQCRERLGAR
jgi:hypothetical protein